MDFFKPRREGSPEAESARSLEQLLTTPSVPASAPESKPPRPVSSSSMPSAATNQQGTETVRAESVIAEGFHFNGVVKSKTDLRVDGVLDGDIDVRSLIVGATGSVSGQCRCDTLLIDGRFQGKAECRELHLNASATIDGEVTYSVLRAQRGAQITGKYIFKKRDL